MDIKEIQFQKQYPRHGFQAAESESKPKPMVIPRRGDWTGGLKSFHYERSQSRGAGVSKEAGLVPEHRLRIISWVNGVEHFAGIAKWHVYCKKSHPMIKQLNTWHELKERNRFILNSSKRRNGEE